MRRRRKMSNMVRKATAFEILNHWALAGSFFILAVSGFGFLFHLEELNLIFGSFNTMKVWHDWSGVVFIISLFLTTFHYLPVSLRMGSDDMEWFSRAGGYLSKKVKAPPQDELNAGQKVYYLFVLAAGIVISVSGIVIWLRPWGTNGILLSQLLHNIGFDLMVVAIPAHIYLATLANPGTFRIMVYGTVPVEWARKKHQKWVRKLGI
jgi:formate dehydrogenase subunit gamma